MGKIDTSRWKDFRIGMLFPVIVKPPVLHSKEVVEAEDGIPYVVRTKFNNGIKCLVERTSLMHPSPGGVITFGAENATFFYQKEEFVSGRDIYYIKIPPISQNAALFLTTCLQKVAKKWLFWHRCGSITSTFPYADREKPPLQILRFGNGIFRSEQYSMTM